WFFDAVFVPVVVPVFVPVAPALVLRPPVATGAFSDPPVSDVVAAADDRVVADVNVAVTGTARTTTAADDGPIGPQTAAAGSIVAGAPLLAAATLPGTRWTDATATSDSTATRPLWANAT